MAPAVEKMSESYSMSESVHVNESSQPISTSEKHDLSSADHLNSHFQLPAVFFKDTVQTPVGMVKIFLFIFNI